MLLRTRIIVFVLLAVSGVAGLVFAVGALRERDMADRIADLQLQQLEQAWSFAVAATADHVAARLTLTALGDDPLTAAVAAGDRAALTRLAGAAFAGNAFLRVHIFSAGGELLWASDAAAEPVPLLGAGRLADLPQDGRALGGARALGDGQLGVAAAVAVRRGPQGAPVGALAAAVPLTPALEAFQRAAGGRLYLRDLDGRLLFGRDDPAWRAAAAGLSTARRALTLVDFDGRHLEAAVLPAADLMGGRLATLTVLRDVTAAVESRMLWERASTGATVMVFAVAMLLLYLYLRRNFEVLDDAVAALHNLSRGQRGGYVELPHGADEIGRIAVAVEAFGHAVGEVARAGAQRERRQRRQQRFIRRQMEQLAATLEDDARRELLAELIQMEAAAGDPQSAQSRAVGDELGLIALGFSRLATKVSVQQVQLTQLVRDLREALEDKRKLISLQQELEIAASMQLSILPRQFPDLPMLDMTASMDPAKEVGGDFYDVFEVRDGVLGVVVADVSGKGIPAAFFMLISRTMLRTVAAAGCGPAETLSRLNNLLAAENEQMMFVTIFYAEIDLASGVATYCSGGHNPPFVARADGRVEMVAKTAGIALATFPDLPYSEKSLTLEPGDTLFMYTDGVSEAFAADEAMYGEARLHDVLARSPPASAAEALERVMADLTAFTAGAEQSDDITAVAVHWRG